MSNAMQVFSNAEFGEVRTVVIDNEVWFVGKDIAEKLGYSNTRDAISNHVDKEDKGVEKIDTLGGTQSMTVINESGIYGLAVSSTLPNARKFRHWLTSEVIPSIRKTGSYTAKKVDDTTYRSRAMYMNARSRQAAILMKLAEMSQTETYKQVLIAKSSEIINGGTPLLPMPEAKKDYSAGDIGKMFGISASKVGRIANAKGLKTEKYGHFVADKSQYSNREVSTFRYYESAIEVFKAEIKG